MTPPVLTRYAAKGETDHLGGEVLLPDADRGRAN